MRDKAAKAAYDRARRARLHVDTRPRECAVCGAGIEQAATSVRLYCSGACRSRQFYARHGYTVGPPVEPMPMPYVGHEWFELARDAAHVRADYASDFGQNDWMGEAILAIAEGRDPKLAVRTWRRREAAIEYRGRRLGHTLDIGTDGEHIWLVREEAESAA